MGWGGMVSVLRGLPAANPFLIALLGATFVLGPAAALAQKGPAAKPSKRDEDDDDDDENGAAKKPRDPADAYPGLKGGTVVKSDPLPKGYTPPPEPPIQGE